MKTIIDKVVCVTKSFFDGGFIDIVRTALGSNESMSRHAYSGPEASATESPPCIARTVKGHRCQCNCRGASSVRFFQRTNSQFDMLARPLCRHFASRHRSKDLISGSNFIESVHDRP